VGTEAQRPLESAVEDLVDYLLFVDESPLPGPIAGPSAFAAGFSASGPRDGKGRSLRDLIEILRDTKKGLPSYWMVDRG